MESLFLSQEASTPEAQQTLAVLGGAPPPLWAFSPCRAVLHPLRHAWSEALLGVCPTGLRPSVLPASLPVCSPSATQHVALLPQGAPVSGSPLSRGREESIFEPSLTGRDCLGESKGGRVGLRPLQSWVQFKGSPSEDAAPHLSSPLAPAGLPWHRTVEDLAV